MTSIAFNLRHVGVTDGGGGVGLSIADDEVIFIGTGDVPLGPGAVLFCDRC